MDSEWVDFGLPSGLKWSKCNVGANVPEDYGLYFSWGNVIGYDKDSGHTYDNAAYASTTGSTLTADIPVNAMYDAAKAIIRDCRMPSSTEFKELNDNTDHENTTINGVDGMKFMKKTDHSVFIFIPYSGVYDSSSVSQLGMRCVLWSSTYISSGQASFMDIYPGSINPQNNTGIRRMGFAIRPVK